MDSVEEETDICGRNQGRPCNKREVSRVWKRRLEKIKQPVQELGEFLGRRGAYFLKRGNGERAIYSFSEPIISLNRAHIMGAKPTEGYIAHPADATRLEETKELHFNDYAKTTTRQERHVILQTVSKP